VVDSTTGFSYLDVLALAGDIRRQASANDLDAVEVDLVELDAALRSLDLPEDDRPNRYPGATAAVARGGRRRIRRIVDALLEASGNRDGATCVLQATRLELALRRQLRFEATVLRHRNHPMPRR
jgi:hypothetical protein